MDFNNGGANSFSSPFGQYSNSTNGQSFPFPSNGNNNGGNILNVPTSSSGWSSTPFATSSNSNSDGNSAANGNGFVTSLNASAVNPFQTTQVSVANINSNFNNSNNNNNNYSFNSNNNQSSSYSNANPTTNFSYLDNSIEHKSDDPNYQPFQADLATLSTVPVNTFIMNTNSFSASANNSSTANTGNLSWGIGGSTQNTTFPSIALASYSFPSQNNAQNNAGLGGTFTASDPNTVSQNNGLDATSNTYKADLFSVNNSSWNNFSSNAFDLNMPTSTLFPSTMESAPSTLITTKLDDIKQVESYKNWSEKPETISNFPVVTNFSVDTTHTYSLDQDKPLVSDFKFNHPANDAVKKQSHEAYPTENNGNSSTNFLWSSQESNNLQGNSIGAVANNSSSNNNYSWQDNNTGGRSNLKALEPSQWNNNQDVESTNLTSKELNVLANDDFPDITQSSTSQIGNSSQLQVVKGNYLEKSHENDDVLSEATYNDKSGGDSDYTSFAETSKAADSSAPTPVKSIPVSSKGTINTQDYIKLRSAQESGADVLSNFQLGNDSYGMEYMGWSLHAVAHNKHRYANMKIRQKSPVLGERRIYNSRIQSARFKLPSSPPQSQKPSHQRPRTSGSGRSNTRSSGSNGNDDINSESNKKKQPDNERLENLSRPRSVTRKRESAPQEKSSRLEQPPWVDINKKEYSYFNYYNQSHFEELKRIYDPPPTQSKSNTLADRSSDNRSGDEGAQEEETNRLSPKRPNMGRPSSSTRTRRPPPSQQQANAKTNTATNQAGSKPLEYSKKFGERGRQIFAQRKLEEKLRVVPPLPVESEDLLETIGKIMKKITLEFATVLSSCIPFAESHRQDLLRSYENTQSSNKTVDLRQTDLIIQKVYKVYQENMSNENTDRKTSNIFKEAIPSPRDELGEHLPLLHLLEFLGSIPNHRSLEESMTVVLWLLCDRSSIGDDDANCFLPVRPLQDDDEEDICMVQTIMSSFDNYINTTRDITRESTRLLSDRGPKEEKQGRKETKHILMELKNWYKASTRLLESHYLAVGQRKFNCSRYSLSMKSNRSRANSASVFGGADGDEHNKYHEMTPRLINGSVLNDDKSQAYSANSVHNRSKTLSKGENIHAAKSGSTIMQYFDNHTSMADKEAQSSPSYKEVNKPIAKGPIVPIGSSPGKESRPTITQSNNDKIYNDSDLIDVKCQLHEGLQCYRQASKWQESGLLLPEQLSQLKAKKILIDDKFFYPQKWIITKVGPVPQNGDGELSIGRLSTSKFSSHRLKSQQDSYINPMLDDAYDDYYHSNNFSADSNFSMNSLQPSGRVSEGSSVAQPPGGINLLPEVPFSNDPEYMFFTYAPLINQTQRDALLFSLTSDICTTILLDIIVLWKHANAGKDVNLVDIVTLFGKPLTVAIGKKPISKLVYWFKSNRKSDFSFKSDSTAHNETVFLRLYAFWPKLQIILKNIADEDEDYIENSDFGFSNTSRCQVILKWPDRVSLNKVFRNPNSYQPNLNVI